MSILLLYAGPETDTVKTLDELIKAYGFTVDHHNISNIWDEDEELIMKLTSSAYICVIVREEDLKSDWCTFVTGYCMGKERGLILKENENLKLPSFMTSVVQSFKMENLRTQLEQWKKRAEIDKARSKLHSLGLYLTPYHFVQSIKKDQLDVVKTFIHSGLSPDTRDEKEVPALNLAVRGNLTEIALFLIDEGCNINAIAKDRNNSALMDAAAAGNMEVIRRLIQRGADLNIQSKSQQTALMLAVGEKRVEVVRLLCEAGADKEIKDALGLTAWQYAKMLKHDELLEIFNVISSEP